MELGVFWTGCFHWQRWIIALVYFHKACCCSTDEENIPTRDLNQWRGALAEHEQLLKRWEKAWESCDDHRALWRLDLAESGCKHGPPSRWTTPMTLKLSKKQQCHFLDRSLGDHEATHLQSASCRGEGSWGVGVTYMQWWCGRLQPNSARRWSSSIWEHVGCLCTKNTFLSNVLRAVLVRNVSHF